ncbi:unnamed protein product [Auanema sp. JU1783]|nr:unnamed protein product [Auanema sp. JU1783]
MICLLLLLIVAPNGSPEEISELPKCKHINPYENLNQWLQIEPLEHRNCNYTSGPETKLTEEERVHWKFGLKSFAFDVLASDRIGPLRKVESHRHQLCSKTDFTTNLSVSIIIIHHNEALSVLLRMLIGIFERTPLQLLKEIILYEDASESEHQLTSFLKQAIEQKQWTNVRVERSDERQGLIRAKVFASRLATADVLVFLDSHCEVADGWIEPLLAPIQEDPRSVVVPIVDLINPISFEYSQAMIAKSGFDWALNFQWVYLPWEYWAEEENNVKPFKSPSMPGGLFAIRKDYFEQLGEYDEGLEIWGGENVELSLKTWMCGGRVLIAPCSRVGHVFRMRRPYKSKPGMDTNLFNSLRVARAWLDDYEKYFIRARPNAARLDAGDVSHANKIKEALKCKDMKWFVENVYPELTPNDWIEKREEL